MPAAIVTLIWLTPTNCGDNPENVTLRRDPADQHDGLRERVPLLVRGVGAIGGRRIHAPKPVAKMTSPVVSPIFAGRVVKPGMEFAGRRETPVGIDRDRLSADVVDRGRAGSPP